MQIIRLTRVGRRNLSSFRVVLTEHSKPVKSGYSEVLGVYDPIRHEFSIKADRVKELLTTGVQLSERVAKLMFKETKDAMYKKFFTEKTTQRTTKNPDKYS
jgi:ribosomal protein S16